MIPVVAFRSNSTKLIPRQYLISPLGIRTIVCQAYDLAKNPSQNSTCMSTITFPYFVTSMSSPHIAYWGHWKRCSTCIPDVPPEWFRHRILANSAISPYPGIESSMGKGVTFIVMDLTNREMWR